MKKAIYLLWLSLIFGESVIGQIPLLENGNFSTYSGTQSTSGGCTWFNVGQMPTWIRSHGSAFYNPAFSDGYYPPHQSVRLGANSSDGTGDGIVVNYNFVAGQCYEIHLDFEVEFWNPVAVTSWTTANTDLEIFATSGIVAAGPPPGSCQDNAPVFAAEHITSENVLIFGTYYVGSIINYERICDDCYPVSGSVTPITFTPAADHSQLWFILNPPSSGLFWNNVWINSVVITPCDGPGKICDEELVFANDVIPPADYNYANEIYAGNSYGTNPDIVSTDPNVFNTTFIATSSITLSPNFISKPNNNSFLAMIDPTNCPNGYYPGTGTGRMSSTETGNDLKGSLNNLGAITKIDVFPNPTQSNITITYPCIGSGQLEITIKDAAGRVRYNESVNCMNGNTVEHSVDMGAFAAGVYFVELTLNEQNIVKKIVKL